MPAEPTRPLFRPAALEAKRTPFLGEIVLIRPLAFGVITAFAVAAALLVAAFLFFGSYTQRSTVPGALVPDTGLIKVHPRQPGVVLEKHVAEGQAVTQGQVLYVLSSERHSATARGGAQAAISAQVEVRAQSLRQELDTARRREREERAALAERIAALDAERANLDRQIDSQRARVALAEENLGRYRTLVDEGFVSKAEWQQKQGELLDQSVRLQTLERERIAIQRERAARAHELADLPLKQANLRAELERGLARTHEELTESETRRGIVVVAPATGTATAAVGEVGQAFEGDRPLVAIIPAGASLQAHLYVPSKAAGFIKPGDPVRLRYQAYPYQKFGQHQGVVAAVSKTALPAAELTGTAAAPAGEPIYRVIVTLAAQTIDAYGRPQPLQAGMLLEADVLRDTRRLYEWVLEPLYSVSGKL